MFRVFPFAFLGRQHSGPGKGAALSEAIVLAHAGVA